MMEKIKRKYISIRQGMRLLEKSDTLLPSNGTMYKCICQTPEDLKNVIVRLEDDAIQYCVDTFLVDFVDEHGVRFSKRDRDFHKKMQSRNFNPDKEQEPDYPEQKPTMVKTVRFNLWDETRAELLEEERMRWSPRDFTVLVKKEKFPILAIFWFDKDFDRIGSLTVQVASITSMNDLNKKIVTA